MSVAAHVLKRAGFASLALVALALMLVMTPTRALAQDQNQNQGQDGGRGGPGGGRGNFDPEAMRKMISDRMRERVGASEEEWSVLGPKVERVMQLNMQAATGGGMGGLFGGRGRGGPGGGGPGGDRNREGERGDRGDRGGDRGDRGRGGPRGFFGVDENSPVFAARRELERAVEANASADDLKAKMAALRDARAKVREETTKAQQELRELLTMKQEAALVTMGILE